MDLWIKNERNWESWVNPRVMEPAVWHLQGRTTCLCIVVCRDSVLAASVLSGLWQRLMLMVQGFVSLVDVTSIMKYTGIIRFLLFIASVMAGKNNCMEKCKVTFNHFHVPRRCKLRKSVRSGFFEAV